MATNQRFKIRVPLGDAAHPDEEKGTTKIVRRLLSDLSGKAPNRKGVVYWRGQHYAATEGENATFDCGKVVKRASAKPEPKAKKAAAKKASAKKGTRKAPARKRNGSKKTAAKAAAGATSESD